MAVLVTTVMDDNRDGPFDDEWRVVLVMVHGEQ